METPDGSLTRTNELDKPHLHPAAQLLRSTSHMRVIPSLRRMTTRAVNGNGREGVRMAYLGPRGTYGEQVCKALVQS